ncbi:hypothetical protein Q428_11045 [Fervidicella metallireducens AeB]|uniref:Uncharacterized protein n=1 Tax=Fervidicella metallireducens AeB TaxID=1403537 RepID=A0A017RT42_9CLOT|nr:hypothetical protein [Fervidicella metallireducens]EYE87842.1 hypothetical protein Q428_11045 [Fervidicella metallireducens AeB]
MSETCNITGFENEERACCFILEITGNMKFDEKLCKDVLKEYAIEYKDIKDGEKIIKISRWFNDNGDIRVKDIFNCII